MGSFVHRHRVRYHETDAQYCVYNARYLEIVDVAMTEFLRDLGWDYREMVEFGFDPSLVHVELDFKRPARFDEVLAVEVVPTKVGNSSFVLDFQLDGEQGLVATASIVYVNNDPGAGGGSRPLPEPVAERLRERLAGG